MSTLSKKIDFVLFFSVNGANPNGDPLMGNTPRTGYEGYGEVSDVAIKRKIRNRLQDSGQEIFVKSQERIDDGFMSLEARFKKQFNDKDTTEKVVEESCKKWLDVRAFGQVMTYQKRSIGIRGPVSISRGKSLDIIDVISMQITRSTNGMQAEEGKQRSSDTMGTKHFVEFGVYKVCGSINCYFAEKNGFTDEDAELIKQALLTLFENDMSSARPEGSMAVERLYWFTHPNKIGCTSSAHIHNLVDIKRVNPESISHSFTDYDISLNQDKLASYKDLGLEVEELV